MEHFRASNGTVEMELESMRPWRFIIILCVSACVHEAPQEAQIPFASQASPLIVEPTESGILEIELEASQLENSPNRLLKYGFNQMSPGPVLLAPVGTELRATLVNQLEMPTTLHWHGAGAPNTMDGTPRVQDPVLPGETFQYEFTLSNPGTFWYHPHFDTARQVDLGLYGMVIVYEPSEPQPDERLVLVFDSAAENQPREMIDDHRHIDGHGMHWLINGSTKDTFEVSSGAVVRAHLLNASNAGYLHLNSEGMRVIAHDQGYQGTVHDGPLVLGPGDRAEVEWLPGADPILVDHRPFSLNGGVTYMPEETLFSLVPLGDAPAASPSAMPVSTPEYKDYWTTKSADFTYVFHGDSRTNSWMLNGESFPDVTPFRTNVGREVIIEVRNLSSTNHPFHTHGHPFKVVSRNGNPVDPRNLHDTIDVAIFETMRLVVNTYNPGEWMVHCHILPHAYAGMMTYMIVE